MKPDYSPLWKWARIRENVRVRKERGDPYPWTDSKIITKYSFCNVRREDDRVTRWIDRHVRKPFADNKNLWFMLCVARVLNWPDTLRELIQADTGDLLACWPVDDRFDLRDFAHVLFMRSKAGEKVFTGAYTITAPPEKGVSKVEFVTDVTLGNLWEDRARFYQHFAGTPSLQSTHNLLKEYKGWGNFMAYQAVVDMRFTKLLCDACDLANWAAAGPGTVRGLNRLHNRDLDFSINQKDALDEIREIYYLYPKYLDFEIDFSDVPNMLCETDKYLRVLHGEGAPRALYVPKAKSLFGAN